MRGAVADGIVMNENTLYHNCFYIRRNPLDYRKRYEFRESSLRSTRGDGSRGVCIDYFQPSEGADGRLTQGKTKDPSKRGLQCDDFGGGYPGPDVLYFAITGSVGELVLSRTGAGSFVPTMARDSRGRVYLYAVRVSVPGNSGVGGGKDRKGQYNDRER